MGRMGVEGEIKPRKQMINGVTNCKNIYSVSFLIALIYAVSYHVDTFKCHLYRKSKR